MNWFRKTIKKHFYYYFIRHRFAPAVSIVQRELYLKYRSLPAEQLPPLKDTGFRVFSQFEEDGLLLYIFSLLGMDKKTFVEIGSADGINSNCANLYFHHGWHGVFIDADRDQVEIGRRFYARHPHEWMYKPVFIQGKVTRENINELITQGEVSGEIGLVSIDIDGNDYWVWDAIDVVQPQVVIIETHNEFGMNNIVVPYNPDYSFPGRHPVYHGASPVAMTRLAERKGYRLVGANQYGFNFIYIREDLLSDQLPAAQVEELLKHPSAIKGMEKFEEIRDWEYLEG